MSPGAALDEVRRRAGLTWDELEDHASRSTIARALHDKGSRLATWLALLDASGVAFVELHGQGEPVRLSTRGRLDGAAARTTVE